MFWSIFGSSFRLPGFCSAFGPGVTHVESEDCGWKKSATIPAECFRKTSNTGCKLTSVTISQLTINISDWKSGKYDQNSNKSTNHSGENLDCDNLDWQNFYLKMEVANSSESLVAMTTCFVRQDITNLLLYNGPWLVWRRQIKRIGDNKTNSYVGNKTVKVDTYKTIGNKCLLLFY